MISCADWDKMGPILHAEKQAKLCSASVGLKKERQNEDLHFVINCTNFEKYERGSLRPQYYFEILQSATFGLSQVVRSLRLEKVKNFDSLADIASLNIDCISKLYVSFEKYDRGVASDDLFDFRGWSNLKHFEI